MKDMKKLMEMLKEESPAAEMSPGRAKAKLEVLKELLQMAEGMEADEIAGGLKKVTVAAPDKEGLKKGLEKAEDMMESEDGESEDEMSDDEEEDDSEEMMEE